MVGVSRAGYYRFLLRAQRPEADMELRSQIQSIALRWPAYGYRRIQAELERQGSRVNHKCVLRLMRVDNLLCLRRRKFILTTDSKHGLPIYSNLAKDMRLTGINQLWVADITYIRLAVEFVYLAVILDAFSPSCVGWALQRSLEAALVLEALRMALRRRHPGRSDRTISASRRVGRSAMVPRISDRRTNSVSPFAPMIGSRNLATHTLFLFPRLKIEPCW